MLTDPIAVAANAPTPALSFVMIQQDGLGSQRRDPTGVYALVINHSTSKSGDRHYVKLTQTVNATNPYNALVTPQSASVSVSIAKPAFGFDDAALLALWQAILDAISSADAGMDRIIGFES